MATELLTAKELASRLGLSECTIGKWARAGKIPSVKPSPRVVLFDWEDVAQAIKRLAKSAKK